MKKLLVLAALMAVTGASVGCNCCRFGRRADYCAPYETCDPCAQPCDNCQPGGFAPAIGAPVGGPVYTTPPTTVVPHPASTSRYLPR